MEKFTISQENWTANYDECKETCIANFSSWIAVRPSANDQSKSMDLFYITWTKVWSWLKYNYPDFSFVVGEIGSNFVTGSLFINNKLMGSTVLTLSSFKNGGGETPEQLINRVFVKLVAQYTGFGFHLWLEPEVHKSQKKPKNNYNKPDFNNERRY